MSSYLHRLGIRYDPKGSVLICGGARLQHLAGLFPDNYASLKNSVNIDPESQQYSQITLGHMGGYPVQPLSR